MTGWRTRLERMLLRHAERVMPRGRHGWARAMAGELEHVLERERLAFVLGCVTSSYRERLTDPATRLAAGRAAIVLGLCAFAALCIQTAFRIDAADPGRLILALGMICAVAAIAFVRWDLRRLPFIAAAGLTCAMLTIVTMAGPDSLVGEAMQVSRFYRAILLEQIAGWVALFGFAHILMTLEKGRAARD